MLMLIVEQDLELNFVVDIVCEIKKEELGQRLVGYQGFFIFGLLQNVLIKFSFRIILLHLFSPFVGVCC